MSYTIQQPSIAGRIGKGFAKGLSEQLPKEIATTRLSSGLKNLGQQDFSALSPLEQLAEIYKIPGMTADLAAQAQQQIQNRQFFGPQPNAPTGIQEQPETANLPINESTSAQPTATKLQGEVPVPSLTEKSSNYGIPLQAQEIEAKAREEYQKNPQRFRSYQEYINYAENQDAKRVQKEQKFEERQLEAEGLFEKGLTNILQSQKHFKDIDGNTKRLLLNKLKAKVDSGLSPARANDEVLKEVLPFVRARNDTKEAMGFFPRFGKKPSDVRARVESARNTYKNIGALQVFRDDLVANGMDDAYANYLAYPVKDHKEINNKIASLPKVKPAFFTSATAEEGKMGKAKKTINEDQIAKEIAPLLTDRDSILSIALALKGRGYDGSEFVREIDRLEKSGELELDPRQHDELSKDFRLKPNLMDLFFFSKAGLDPLLEVQ